jgi:valyl-tRNA synthetase
MKTTYNPAVIEQKYTKLWQENNYFAPQGGDDSYCIMIPPPNVTGTLHMGHALQDTIMDSLIRYHRMLGHNTLWQAGTDHAGIATQMVVERQLNEKNKTRFDLGREEFVKKVWEWKRKSGNRITTQLKRLGSSLDWETERFTMDDGMSAAVQSVFIRLFEEGLIYRGEKLINWDPVLHTALSDLEVIATEEDSFLWHMNYPIVDDNDKYISVATTRPETMFGDSAVAVHPTDERYQNLIGKRVKLPLTNKTLPIIADEYVDKDFGSGAVKITPAHDFNDYEIGLRHNLELINIFDINAKLNDNVPTKYQNMDRFVARKQVIKDLKEQGLLLKIDNHKIMAPRGDRSGVIVEPYLTSQWFVKIDSLAKPAIDVIKKKDIEFVPKNWENTYFNWMENITDWCISRQLWWGHRIPAWYDDDGKIYVGKSEKDIREKYKLKKNVKLKQDEDVLDTWFSSALWPFSTLGWPKKNKRLDTFYPTNVLVTGFDIIFFWVARMIMFGLKFMDDIPFQKIYIHGLIKDSHGQKMSKSKGNVIDPLDLVDGISLEDLIKKRTENLMQPHLLDKIKKDCQKDYPNGIAAFGTDALRWTFASLASTGRDIIFDIKRIEGYRNFINKLYNASRFVLLNCQQQKITKPKNLSIIDKWIEQKLKICINETHKHFANFRFDLLANTLYEFTWGEFCDWYLELIKVHIFGSDTTKKQQSLWMQVNILEKLLRLLHPIIPFITEDLYQRISPLLGIKAETIMLQKYPAKENDIIDNNIGKKIITLKEITTAIRKLRSDHNIKPSQSIKVILDNTNKKDKEYLDDITPYIKKLTKTTYIKYGYEFEKPLDFISTIAGKIKIIIPTGGIIDKNEEKEKTIKQIKKLKKEEEFLEKKLSNNNFINKAPKDIVKMQKDKLAKIKKTIKQLQD